MSETDRDRGRVKSVEWDDWPIERSDPPDVTEEGGTGATTADDYVEEEEYEWVGVSAQTTDPYIVDPGQDALYRGSIDEKNERILVREESREEFDSDESLGERIAEIGDEHGWEWLSSFARTHLEDEDDRDAGDGSREITVRHTEFDEREVTESDDHDLAYTASHTLEDRSGRVHVVERRFDVFDEGDQVTVVVREDFLVAEEPREEDRSGDADLVAQRDDQFSVDVDRSREDWTVEIRESLREWHESNVEWPDASA